MNHNMKCPICGRTDHEPGAKFCYKDGAPLVTPMKCPKCGTILPEPDAKFCYRCGMKFDDIIGPIKKGTSTNSTIINNLIANMVHVEGGTFTMGATPKQASDADSDEKPAHKVTLSSFSIGRYEVTQEEWEAVMGSNPSHFKGVKRPVEQVSWDDCQKFISKLNTMTGMEFRLPTEAEWEYAARGGKMSKGYKYSGGDNPDKVAWYFENSDNQTHNVGQKQPNELGLYDMSGNVHEWCKDWKGQFTSSSQTNPQGPSSGSIRVHRGGCWNLLAKYCRVSFRRYNSPYIRYYDQGLRLALSERE